MSVEGQAGIPASQGVTGCLAVDRGRSYAGRREYAGKAALTAALGELKAAVPAVPGAYKPSGETTGKAIVLLSAMAPVVAVAIMVIVGIIELIYGLLSNLIGVGMISGVGGLLLDLVLIVGVAVGTGELFSFLGKKFKNRNPWGPSILATATVFIATLILFPFSPSFDLTYRDLSIYWVLMPLGIIGATIGTGIHTYSTVANQKFCELSGIFLDPLRKITVPLDYAENAVEALRSGNWGVIPQLPRTVEDTHCAIVTLWWHPEALTGFLEMEVIFRSKSKPVKKMTLEKEEEVVDRWMAHSQQVTQEQAAWLHDVFTAPMA